ncbi:hypothetical protein [Nocardioides sp. GY 10127]|uniref:hypothetical protein n=1 Tax=Nocardioides sp. GY 10127 TaxID=2569762 RepID=UPI0010A89DD9|nr:hypothetical protein [Nocardioides sp. GY 10127]TIC85551.1 hypothetical protein E8D37_02680 [Nocardioides sp. GY 10127]
MSERAVPFHCPYCGDEDLWPHEVVAEDGSTTSPHGSWECRSCLRAFSLRMLGQVARPGSPS